MQITNLKSNLLQKKLKIYLKFKQTFLTITKTKTYRKSVCFLIFYIKFDFLNYLFLLIDTIIYHNKTTNSTMKIIFIKYCLFEIFYATFKNFHIVIAFYILIQVVVNTLAVSHFTKHSAIWTDNAFDCIH